MGTELLHEYIERKRQAAGYYNISTEERIEKIKASFEYTAKLNKDTDGSLYKTYTKLRKGYCDNEEQ